MKNDIQYVCLSDLHLGEEDSLLTCLKPDPSKPGYWVPDPGQASPIMTQLAECLGHLIDNANEGRSKPILILNGDILELALATTNVAAMVFERFMDLVMIEGEELFDGIIYVPGNHDHHLWESARETQYVEHMGKIGLKDPLPIPYHATSMFARELSDRPPSYFLTRLLRRRPHLAERGFSVKVAYPNLAVVDGSGQKCAIFHHGHFIDSLYHLMSSIKTHIFENRQMPEFTWDIEAENFAWIDFFWSTLGRSGEIGRDIELIYEKMQDKDQFKKLLSGIVRQLERKYDLPGWDPMTGKTLRTVLHVIADLAMKTERGDKAEPLSTNGERGLRSYVEGPLFKQIRKEREKQKEEIPSEYTFVFGHTHKPFQEDMSFAGYEGWVNVYNTGGWVVDTMKPEPLHGASIVLIDYELNATSIRMYNQGKDAGDYPVCVRESRHYWEEANPFHKKIYDLVDSSDGHWKAFSEKAAEVIGKRAEYLRRRILSDDC